MANEFRNMIKVFVFVIEGIVIKTRKATMKMNVTKRYDEQLVDVYFHWNKMYMFSRKEHFLESDLDEFKV